MEGKIISYFHQVFQAYVFLGCTQENPRNVPQGQKPFNPDTIPGCVNALGIDKDIDLKNLIGEDDSKLEVDTEFVMMFKVRDRAKNDNIKSLVQG